MLHAGQKVVCIKECRTGGAGFENKPEVGSVYTIREVGPDPLGEPWYWVWLEEIRNEPAYYRKGEVFAETGFAPFCFRPVVDKKTDISIFQEMCKDTSDRQPEGVV